MTRFDFNFKFTSVAHERAKCQVQLRKVMKGKERQEGLEVSHGTDDWGRGTVQRSVLQVLSGAQSGGLKTAVFIVRTPGSGM